MGKLKLITNDMKTIDVAFEEFQQFNKIKDLSEHTIKSYEATYRAFTECYSEDNLCSNLNIQAIYTFINHLRESRNVNNISINTHLTNIKSFKNYCVRLGYLEDFKISLLRAEKKIKETYTDSELAILLQKPNIKKCSFVQYRNWAIINYLVRNWK